MKGLVVRKLKEMGIRKVEGKKLELYNYYTLCMFLDKVNKELSDIALFLTISSYIAHLVA